MNFIKVRGEDGQWHDVFVLNGEIMLPIAVGDGQDSLLMAGAKAALGASCVAIGPGSTAGRMAYYIKAIDTASKKIYLSKTQHTLPDTTSTDFSVHIDTTFETPAYAVGDEFSIICNSHYNFADKIAAIENNCITWAGVCSLPTPYTDSGDTAFTFHVPSKPHIGVVKLGDNAFAVGEENKANGEGTFVGGKNNIASGEYGAIFGKDNKGGYGALIGGRANKITGNNSGGIGSNNTVDAKWTFVSGDGNNVSSPLSLVAGDGNNVAGTNNNVVIGTKNSTDGKFVDISGNNNVTTGDGHGVRGASNNVSGAWNNIHGRFNNGRGNNGFIAGNNCTIDGGYDQTLGYGNNIAGDYNIGIGYCLRTYQGLQRQIVLGKFNKFDGRAIFSIGVGESEESRKNAMVITTEGETIFNGSVQATEFIDAEGNSITETIGDIETALDSIIAMQEALIGGDTV